MVNCCAHFGYHLALLFYDTDRTNSTIIIPYPNFVHLTSKPLCLLQCSHINLTCHTHWPLDFWSSTTCMSLTLCHAVLIGSSWGCCWCPCREVEQTNTSSIRMWWQKVGVMLPRTTTVVLLCREVVCVCPRWNVEVYKNDVASNCGIMHSSIICSVCCWILASTAYTLTLTFLAACTKSCSYCCWLSSRLALACAVTFSSGVVKCKTRPCFCRKSTPRITWVIHDGTAVIRSSTSEPLALRMARGKMDAISYCVCRNAAIATAATLLLVGEHSLQIQNSIHCH